MLQNRKGAVFDIPHGEEKVFKNISDNLDNKNLRIFVCENLPALEEQQQRGGRGGGRFGGRQGGRGGYGGRSGGYGGRQGGYGGRSGGYGGRQSYGGNRGGYGDRQSYGGDRRNNDRRNDRRSQGPSEKDKQKLFVGNLSYNTNENSFRDFVQQSGLNPSDIYLVKNHDGTSKGFGYLGFNSEQDASRAFGELQRGRMDGRSLRVDYADKRN